MWHESNARIPPRSRQQQGAAVCHMCRVCSDQGSRYMWHKCAGGGVCSPRPGPVGGRVGCTCGTLLLPYGRPPPCRRFELHTAPCTHGAHGAQQCASCAGDTRPTRRPPPCCGAPSPSLPCPIRLPARVPVPVTLEAQARSACPSPLVAVPVPRAFVQLGSDYRSACNEARHYLQPGIELRGRGLEQGARYLCRVGGSRASVVRSRVSEGHVSPGPRLMWLFSNAHARTRGVAWLEEHSDAAIMQHTPSPRYCPTRI